MGTMTITIDNETENAFRSAVEKELGKGKGRLGAAITEALDLWLKKARQEQIVKRQLAFLERGFLFGKYPFKREELHERKY